MININEVKDNQRIYNICIDIDDNTTYNEVVVIDKKVEYKEIYDSIKEYLASEEWQFRSCDDDIIEHLKMIWLVEWSLNVTYLHYS